MEAEESQGTADDNAGLERRESPSIEENEIVENGASSSYENHNGEVDDTGNPEDDDEISRKQRYLRLENLRFPGTWTQNALIMKFMNKCDHCTAHFSKPANSGEKHIKSVVVDLEFAKVEDAREAYASLRKAYVDGALVHVIVDPLFFKSSSPKPPNGLYFETAEDEEEKRRTVYILGLPATADRNLIEEVVGAEIEASRLIPLSNSEHLMQAQVVMKSENAASAARQDRDGFKIREDETQKPLKLFTTEEYIEMSESGNEAKSFAMASASENRVDEKSSSPEAAEKVNGAEILAPEITEDDVLEKLQQHIAEQRINWAEINEREELYTLCDAVSAQFQGLPDSLLKPVMLTSLQRHLAATETHWMRDHLETLIRMWKAEVMSEEFFDRRTIVRMETVDYKPVPFIENSATRNKGKSKGSRAGRVMLGVGAMLEQARKTILTEEGAFDIEEDDDGNFMIGGETLSFESWAKITKTKQTGVVRAGTPEVEPRGLSKKQQRLKRIVENMTEQEYKIWKKEQVAKRKGDLKMRVMQRARKEQENLEKAEKEKEEVVEGTSEEVKQKKELDEGEIDSEEERKIDAKASKEPKTKKRKHSSSGSSSDSSVSDWLSTSDSEDLDDDDIGDVKARERRNQRRKKEQRKKKYVAKKQTAQPTAITSAPWLKTTFEQRKAFVSLLPPAHKVAFATALSEIRQGNINVPQLQAAQAMNEMSTRFRSYFGPGWRI
ncbi:unnamed protein product [Caenorhabditis auriculariae]|uniref:RRM domain-containing protein n=1 Tax=Caenorhabditis auriculariae TaxID=2777116 RepID=A0A8S1HI95_9PELO|nr:unnamed protein product [Caenorhabditis auriculariae]